MAVTRLTLVLVAVAAAAGSALAEPQFPALTGRVVDEANLLDQADRAILDSQLAALEEKSTDQLVVVTLPSLQGYPIEDFGYRLGRHWAIGQAGKDNGVLLIVAPKERDVRIEVGRGLEPVLTDALSKLVIENTILPRFRDGDYASGIKDGVRDIVSALTGDAAGVEERARARRDANNPQVDLITFAIWILIWAIVIAHIWWTMHRAFGSGGSIFVPGGGSGRRSSGWSGGSGRSGGGGFSGGGGSFGGGGASGRW